MKNKMISFFALIALMFPSCEYNNKPFVETPPHSQEVRETKVIRNIQKLENPYSVTNMKKAYQILKKEGKINTTMDIVATHLYVRFLPKDTAEVQKLYNDTTLKLFQYPLDCELTEGTTYEDPTLVGTNLRWLYTRVPVGYSSPISDYEVLDELYLPTPEYYTKNAGIAPPQLSQSFIYNWNKLEEKSLELTGNLEESNNRMQKSPWYPQALIRVYDDNLEKYIPVPGALVVAQWWFNWQYAVTDVNGLAKFSQKRRRVNWSIEWKARYWEIRDGLFWLAVYRGGPSSSNWYLNINDPYSKAYAHVQRACFTMFYGDNLGATDRNKNWHFESPKKIKISVHNISGGGTAGVNYGHNWFIFAQIAIYMKNSNNNLVSSQDIYATTIHELAHSFHIREMDVDLLSYAFVKPIIYESWASAVECLITHAEYQKLSGNRLETYELNRQWWSIPIKNNGEKISIYTPIFIDLVDNYNQNKYYNSRNREYPNDDVDEYTLSELRNILRITFNISDLKKQVKNIKKNQGTTSVDLEMRIDKLFETYEKVK